MCLLLKITQAESVLSYKQWRHVYPCGYGSDSLTKAPLMFQLDLNQCRHLLILFRIPIKISVHSPGIYIKS